MRRSVLLALIIGSIAVLGTAILYEFGLLEHAAAKLLTYYANAGLLDPQLEPNRLFHYTAFFALGFSSAWAVLDIPHPAHKALVSIATLLLLLGASVCLVTLGIFFEPFSSIAAVTIASVLGLIYSATEFGAQKRILHEVLGGRVSESAIARLQEEAPPAFLSGHDQPVTVLTARIFNHALLRTQVSPQDLIAMTSSFLKNSGEFLTGRGGYLDEAGPDCVRVFFGITDISSSHADAACDAAIELRLRLSNLNEDLERRFFHRFDYGIALSSDTMTVGIYQSEFAPRLSAVGEVVEYVRKLSAANSSYGSAILISSTTYAHVRERFAVRPMELIYDAETEVMTESYELLDRASDLTQEDDEARTAFWQGVILYREGRADEALEIFSRLRSGRPHDRPLQYFIDRAQSKLLGDDPAPDSYSFLLNGHARILQSF